MKLVTSGQIQEIDSIAINKLGVPSIDLMENAGSRTAEIILNKIKKSDLGLVIVGKGNNGGDGLVIARLLLENGIKLSIMLLHHPDQLSLDAKTNYDKLKSLEPAIYLIEDERSVSKAAALFDKSDFIVDAVFGTGLKSEVMGRHHKIIEKINSSKGYVFAVDMPSGLSADTGSPLGIAVRAHSTITFGLPKVGQVVPPGPDYVGELHVAGIGLPANLVNSYKTDMNLIVPELFKKYFLERASNSHKGDYGHVLVIAGSATKLGAGWLTSKTALRSGAGLVTYAMPDGAYTKFDTRFAEVMVEPVYDKKRGRFIDESMNDIKNIVAGKTVVATGPGIGTKTDTAEFVKKLVLSINLPMVIDADGLNNLEGHTSLLKKRKADTILTPHPGEMSKLTGISTKNILADRINTARNFSREHGVYLVLKGHRTIVAYPDGEIFINPTGNPGMATAGMGDALTGMIAAFAALNIPVKDAVIAAVYIHGLAGDISAANIGEMGLITSDVIEKIPEAVKIVKNSVENENII